MQVKVANESSYESMFILMEAYIKAHREKQTHSSLEAVVMVADLISTKANIEKVGGLEQYLKYLKIAENSLIRENLPKN